MTINLLITGQVRDRENFSRLCNSLAAMAPQQPRVVFSTWTNELDTAEEIANGIEGLEIEFADCGSALPLDPSLNRNLKSFLVQYQQLLFGFRHFSGPNHVVRIRADTPFPEQIPQLLKSVETAINNQNVTTQSIVVGGSATCPYFIEDRIMILSERHRERISKFSFAELFEYDTHNLFPEFLFYTMMASPLPETLSFDYMYGAKAGHSALVEYRKSYFGGEFFENLAYYLEDFESNFVFLGDLISMADAAEIFGSIIPSSYGINNMADFRSGWAATMEVSVSEDRKAIAPMDRGRTLRLRRHLLSLELKYAAGKNAEIVKEFEKVRDYGCFQSRADDLFGCSLFVIGRPESAFKYLYSLFERGWRGFEHMFYLTAAAKKTGNIPALDATIAAYLQAFPGNKRVEAHAAALLL